MEKYLRDNFSVDHKHPSNTALLRWRSAVSVVKNPRRRFRMVANLAQRADADKKRKKLQVIPFHSLFLTLLL
ncbi:putative calcium-transporting ATPase [Lupinus albus]|uniref:Putative calcium-transporting ATPase n=1 Tax=Lupinus albus TaxID=3870 RepID=A0A6A4QR79_LUPAL|nr:putative calcium-transporting ATPase [Lupinus albus]